MKIHPYALILGVVIGIMTLVVLRHPIFALVATVIGVLGLDVALKNNTKKLEDDDKNEDSK